MSADGRNAPNGCARHRYVLSIACRTSRMRAIRCNGNATVMLLGYFGFFSICDSSRAAAVSRSCFASRSCSRSSANVWATVNFSFFSLSAMLRIRLRNVRSATSPLGTSNLPCTRPRFPAWPCVSSPRCILWPTGSCAAQKVAQSLAPAMCP